MTGFRQSPLTACASMWTQAIVDYSAHQAASGASPGTIRLRQHYLRNLALRNPRGPWTVTLDDLVRFVARNDWSAETRKAARGAVRSFYGWAELTGRAADNPARLLPSVRIPLCVGANDLTSCRRGQGRGARHDLFAVQRLLGHSKPETTARYTAIPDESLRAAVGGIRAILAAA